MQDCGCENDTFNINLKTIKFEEGVGEGIFENNDIFDRVKKYYSEYERDEDEDLLLENLNNKDNDEYEFVQDLLEVKIVKKMYNNIASSSVLYHHSTSESQAREPPALSEAREISSLNERVAGFRGGTKDNNEDIEEDIIEKNDIIVQSEKEDKKINYIKDYLNSLKNGSN